MRGAARLSDKTGHGGMVTSGEPSVLVNGLPAVTRGDTATCPQHVIGLVTSGKLDVLVAGYPMSRILDYVCCAHPQEKSSNQLKASGHLWQRKTNEVMNEHFRHGRTTTIGEGNFELTGTSPSRGSVNLTGKGDVTGLKDSAFAELSLGSAKPRAEVEVKVGTAEAESNIWAGKHDDKWGFNLGGKAALEGMGVKATFGGGVTVLGYQVTAAASGAGSHGSWGGGAGVGANYNTKEEKFTVGANGALYVGEGGEVGIELSIAKKKAGVAIASNKIVTASADVMVGK